MLNSVFIFLVSAARKLYEYCDSAQYSGAKKSIDNSSSNGVKFLSINDYYSTYDDFQFPPPPQHQITSNALKIGSERKNEFQSCSSDDTDSNSDSSQSDCYPLMSKSQSARNNSMYKFRGYLSDGSPVSNILSILPPIGVFWDIENCQVSTLVHRGTHFKNCYKFFCVCTKFYINFAT